MTPSLPPPNTSPADGQHRDVESDDGSAAVITPGLVGSLLMIFRIIKITGFSSKKLGRAFIMV